MLLTGPLPVWDLERRPIDSAEIGEWVLGCIRASGVGATSLERLHDRLAGNEARALATHVCEASRDPAVQRLVHGAIVAALPELPWDRLAIQSVTHVRILVPGDAIAAVPLHTDHGIGHPLHERNLWIPLTAAARSCALHVLPLRESIPVELARRKTGAMLVDAPAPACETAAGELLLLTPVHVHGGRTVCEDATRVSIDIRIAPRDAAAERNPYTFIPPRGFGGPEAPKTEELPRGEAAQEFRKSLA